MTGALHNQHSLIHFYSHSPLVLRQHFCPHIIQHHQLYSTAFRNRSRTHNLHQLEAVDMAFAAFTGAGGLGLPQPQQQNIGANNPAEAHKDVIDMFPELDLTGIIRDFGNMDSQALASIIVDRMEQIPKKRRGPTRDAAAAGDDDVDEPSSSDEEDADLNRSELLVDKLVTQLLRILKTELRKAANNQIVNRQRFVTTRNFLMDQFLSIRCDFIQELLPAFHHLLVPTAIGCFLAEADNAQNNNRQNNNNNKFAPKLSKFAPGLPQRFWLRSVAPLQLPRYRRMQPANQYPQDLRDEYQRYIQIMNNLKQGEFGPLLTNQLKLVKRQEYIRIPWVRAVPEEPIQCLVCLEQFPRNTMVFCSNVPMPTAPQQQADFDAMDEEEEEEEEEEEDDDDDQPGPSNRIYEKKKWTAPLLPMPKDNHTGHLEEGEDDEGEEEGEDEEEDDDQPGPSSRINEKTQKQPSSQKEEIAASKRRDNNINPPPSSATSRSDEDLQKPTHAFCRACLRGHARAATEQQPLAEGGVGLRCMAPDCKNPILYSEVRTLLKKDTRKKLDERILEENIGMASLPNLERCKRCNFAAQMDSDKHVNKVFECFKCRAKFCRLCEREWDDDHFGINCEELAVKMKSQKKDRDLEAKLNEAVIRKCPRCGIMFMKDLGCNKMTCRCGMTQCYLCRKSGIDYTHFCQHMRDPKVPNWKCNQCNKTCMLYEDPNKRDDQLLQQIRQQEQAARLQEPQDNNNNQNQPRANPQAPALPGTQRPNPFLGFFLGAGPGRQQPQQQGNNNANQPQQVPVLPPVPLQQQQQRENLPPPITKAAQRPLHPSDSEGSDVDENYP